MLDDTVDQNLAGELTAVRPKMGVDIVARLRHEKGFNLRLSQDNRGRDHPDRDGQFSTSTTKPAHISTPEIR